ncbi:CAS1 domain-containing protein 1-like [Elysia marginata]|uniref:CAS1 domain-containing protein 1-like n=1 Tax=Elysia marginata TaxID=1093978 RepID=A0AAV4JUE8_9GAST|nr:CAS1 domain-containing protein 1-like [Elysia marginata]
MAGQGSADHPQQQQAVPAVDANPHNVPQFQATPAQYTLFVAYTLILCLWTLHFISSLIGIDLFGDRQGRSRHHSSSEVKDAAEEGAKSGAKRDEEVVLNIHPTGSSPGSKVEGDGVGGSSSPRESSPAETAAGEAGEVRAAGQDAEGSKPRSRPRSSGPPPVTFDRFLTSVVLFGAILFYFYICDYLKVAFFLFCHIRPLLITIIVIIIIIIIIIIITTTIVIIIMIITTTQ